jgi:hypothetical protein
MTAYPPFQQLLVNGAANVSLLMRKVCVAGGLITNKVILINQTFSNTWGQQKSKSIRHIK